MDAPQRAVGAKLMMQEGVSLRRASLIMGVSSAAPYRKPAPRKDGPLQEALQRGWRPNMGYRMAHALVRSEFAPLNLKRVHRVWKELKLGRVKRFRKKRTGASMVLKAQAPGQVWSLDFVHDSCLNGTRLKVLAIIDEFTRECLALEAHTSFKSLRVREVLARLFAERGAPSFLRSDNGSEFISRSLAVFLSQCGAESHFIKPGSPWQNAFIESFNSTLRRECLDVEAFHNLADAQVKLRLYQTFYNQERPHSSLSFHPPVEAMSN